jgi:hypothetical protein
VANMTVRCLFYIYLEVECVGARINIDVIGCNHWSTSTSCKPCAQLFIISPPSSLPNLSLLRFDKRHTRKFFHHQTTKSTTTSKITEIPAIYVSELFTFKISKRSCSAERRHAFSLHMVTAENSDVMFVMM